MCYRYGPPTLWVDVHADSFSLGNARHIGARHPNMVEADNTQVALCTTALEHAPSNAHPHPHSRHAHLTAPNPQP
jgi:hypothetical protein